jgi:hypothetical protein
MFYGPAPQFLIRVHTETKNLYLPHKVIHIRLDILKLHPKPDFSYESAVDLRFYDFFKIKCQICS